MSFDAWAELERPGPETVAAGGTEIGRGARVRLHPRPGREVWDRALEGRTGVVDAIEEELGGGVHLVVAVDEAPPGHRFFFGPDEVEPLRDRRILVAGIGNVFLGDDGFGCEVARRLVGEEWPTGVEVGDFGIRGMDLAYALRDYDAAVLVDAAPLGEPPGTVSVLEPEPDGQEAAIETHAMDPVRVLRLARELGGVPARLLVVACEPGRVVDPDDGDVVVELTEPVRTAVEAAARAVRELVEELTKGGEDE